MVTEGYVIFYYKPQIQGKAQTLIYISIIRPFPWSFMGAKYGEQRFTSLLNEYPPLKMQRQKFIRITRTARIGGPIYKYFFSVASPDQLARKLPNRSKGPNYIILNCCPFHARALPQTHTPLKMMRTCLKNQTGPNANDQTKIKYFVSMFWILWWSILCIYILKQYKKIP